MTVVKKTDSCDSSDQKTPQNNNKKKTVFTKKKFLLKKRFTKRNSLTNTFLLPTIVFMKSICTKQLFPQKNVFCPTKLFFRSQINPLQIDEFHKKVFFLSFKKLFFSLFHQRLFFI